MKITLDQLVENLSDSGLMTADEATSLCQGLTTTDGVAETEAVARDLAATGKLTPYQAQRVCQGLTSGLVFGEYIVFDHIGAGGMGEVLKGRHRSLDREVAIKVLPERSVGATDIVERFHNEMKAAAKVSHQNIVITYDGGQKGDLHFLVMEYLEGRDLSSVVEDDGPMSVDAAVDATLQAAKGLEALHKRRIYHRDVKPANLFLTHDGDVKILDMGLARLAYEEKTGEEETRKGDRLTMSGQIMGTGDYIAPEQAEDTRVADARSDIYSLGCTLYRLLTGNSPYGGDTVMKQLLAHRENPIPSLREAREDVPQALDDLFQSMLAKSPDERPQATTDVIGALEAITCGDSAAVEDAAPPDEALANFFDNMTQLPATTTSSDQRSTKATADKTAAATKARTASVADETIDLRPQGDTSRIIDRSAEATTPPTAAVSKAAEAPTPVKKPAAAKPRRGKKPGRRRQAMPLLMIGIGVGVAIIGAAVLAVVVYVRTNYGTIVVDCRDDNVEILVKQDGQQVDVIDAEKRRWRIRVKAGEYQVEVKGGNDRLALDKDTVTVTRGDEVRVRVERRPHKVAQGVKHPQFAVAPFDQDEAKEHQKAWAKHLGLPVEWTNSIDMKFMLVPPGSFEMGSTDVEIAALLQEAKDASLGKWYGGESLDLGEVYAERVPGEGPRHQVRIDRPFYLGRHEVTVGQFRSFADTAKYETFAERDGKGGAGFDVFTGQSLSGSEHTWRKPGIEQDDDHPVVMVARADAMAFCEWLGEKEGRTVRLPTEIEWEFCCRAGTQTRFFGSDDARCLKHLANVGDASFRRTWKTTGGADEFRDWDDGFPATAPVGSFRANSLGIFDMHGNVWEWCSDDYDRNAYRRRRQGETTPLAPTDETTYVVRGGGWDCLYPGYLRSAYRHSVYRHLRLNSGGFRVVCELKAPGSDGPNAGKR